MTNRNESLAIDIYDWCKKHHLWSDITIYFDGKAFSSSYEWAGVYGKKIDEDLYQYENKNALDYLEYANPDTLSMSFEGPLYSVINGYVSGCHKRTEELLKLFEKYGYYFEQGHAWNLSAYEL